MLDKNNNDAIKLHLDFYQERRGWTYQDRRYDSFSWYQDMMKADFWRKSTPGGILKLSEIPVPPLAIVIEAACEVLGHTEMFEIYRIKIDDIKIANGKPLKSEAANIFMVFEDYMSRKPGNFRSAQIIKSLFKAWAMSPSLYTSIKDPQIVKDIQNSPWMAISETS